MCGHVNRRSGTGGHEGLWFRSQVISPAARLEIVARPGKALAEIQSERSSTSSELRTIASSPSYTSFPNSRRSQEVVTNETGPAMDSVRAEMGVRVRATGSSTSASFGRQFDRFLAGNFSSRCTQ